MPPLIRQEIERLIVLNCTEQWMDAKSALASLEKYRRRLVPGLAKCLDDADRDVRLYTVELLDASGRRGVIALPALIQLLADSDQQLRLTAAHAIQKFGAKAASALPVLEAWLLDDHEYVRLVAATTILCIDPWKRRSLLPLIRQAAESANPVLSGMASEFLSAESG
jgi:HEAT repeat protein